MCLGLRIWFAYRWLVVYRKHAVHADCLWRFHQIKRPGMALLTSYTLHIHRIFNLNSTPRNRVMACNIPKLERLTLPEFVNTIPNRGNTITVREWWRKTKALMRPN